MHAINALVTDCAYPKFITSLLLLNASIFFALFMNFYWENYKKTAARVAPAKTPLVVENNNCIPLDYSIERKDQ